jgi:DNA-binding response OmpR family regulator
MPKKIMIIDDEPDSVKLVTIRLKSAGYDVISSTTCDDALRMLETELPDLILLDVIMPGKDGYELCNEIKSEEKMRHIPIILFTAKADQKSHLKTNAEFIAADDYILKPFDPANLLEKIKSFIG